METTEFYSLVERMRNAQKEYFRTRSKDVLNRSKELEREVDAEIKRAKQEDGQTSLF